MKKFIILLLVCTISTSAYSENLIDMIIVEKSKRELKLIKNGIAIKEFIIDLGFDPVGHKYFKGDGRTPEGLYYISRKSTNSDFYLSLQISYPNKWDIKNARSFNKNAGNYIMIHGQPNIIKNKKIIKDWTNGCIALTNEDVKEIYNYVSINTPIYIMP
ncbi:MAG: hypothetical protein CFH33_01049 [Alphaproteobacteria bacterium MarineAlpha9_Bin3]|nr:MAG: hypothetical protein CFH33_01049 [Alphaproteobacteria bacterium MarineAlpha9_Bin3]